MASLTDRAKVLGISLRQLRWWIKRGFVSGPESEALPVMVDLVSLGFTPDIAGVVAREAVAAQGDYVVEKRGVVITIKGKASE
jgi:hypothetical protein